MRTVFTTLAALALCGVAYVFHAQTRGAAAAPSGFEGARFDRGAAAREARSG